jgi:hypothetical protein
VTALFHPKWGVERKWGQRRRIAGLSNNGGKPNEVDYPRKTEHDAGRDIDSDGNPRSPHRLAEYLVDDHDVDERMVNLYDRQRLPGAGCECNPRIRSFDEALPR